MIAKAFAPGAVGTNYCTPNVNSTGATGSISAVGSRIASANDITLEASSLPASSFGFFLTSTSQGAVANPGGSAGVLCLSGAIGRYVGPGQILSSGSAGSFSLEIDLGAIPTPTGTVGVMPGDTWNFQAWHRDSIGGSAVSNFTGAVAVPFL